jgi:photosystem II stability/assembly factor-like uncharacterized protein
MPRFRHFSCRALGVVAAAVFSASLLASGSAHANGRFPASNQLLVAPNDANRLWLRATQGLLTSPDGGCTWQHVCERAFGVEGEQDPPLSVTSTGSLIAAVFNGVYVSPDVGCTWQRPQTADLNRFAVDVTLEKNDLSKALILISAGREQGGNLNQVWRSADEGATWSKLGADLDPALRLDTIDPAPSDPAQVFMTAQYQSETGEEDVGLLLHSTDGGVTWTERPISGTDSEWVAFLSAVHPQDPNKLYVRVRGPVVTRGEDRYVENRLLYSADAGRTWTEILNRPADMLGFALSPDGSTVLVGLGDSRALGGLRPVNREALGIYRASTSDHQFTRVHEGHVGCLTWAANGVYVCTSEFYQGFELGLSKDEGRTVSAVMHLAGIKEPLACAAGTTVATTCDERSWNEVCSKTNRCDENTFEPLPLVLPAQCRGPSASADDDSGGGCVFAGNGGSSGVLLGIFALGWFAVRRRRGRKTASPRALR